MTHPTLLSPERFNDECFCLSLDEAVLRHALEEELGSPGLADLVQSRCPYLFSAQPVFLPQRQQQRMAAVITAVEQVVTLPSWQERVLHGCDEVVHHTPGRASGVFMGFDFHLRGEQLGLIEINTNAGGAMLNTVLGRAQRACCPEMANLWPMPVSAQRLEQDIIRMFRQEWALAGRDRSLSSIALVDENPEQQYLYPEFILFRRLFEKHGIQAVIADPQQLELRDGHLWCGDLMIDLVYNRLTDFTLEQPRSALIRQALLDDAALVTPHPRAYALYADKFNLTLLTDPQALQELGVPGAIQQVLLQGIPHTERVTPEQAERLWQQRKQLFFKPASGYGSKAAYRGDKLTRGVWAEILKGRYVAQTLVPPGERKCSPDNPAAPLKFDLRNYVYQGQVQWLAARLYQGQTTNFRTPGGGFAPVYAWPESC